MHSATYFVPPASHTTETQGLRGPVPANRCTRAALELLPLAGEEASGQKVAKILLVAGLHLGLLAWLAQSEFSQQREQAAPVRLDVRTIEIPLAAPRAQAGIAALPKAQPPVVRQPAPRATPATAKNQVPAAARATPRKPAHEILSTAASDTGFTQPGPAAQEAAGDKPQSADAAAVSGASGASTAANTATTAARFDADYLRNPAPDYPAASRRMREEGTVYLDVDVTADGKPGALKIKKSSGHARLDEAALEAVRQWRFVPARRGAEAVAAHVVVPVVFRLGA